MRAFIALELSSEIKSALDRLVRSLSALSRDIRWVRTESTHLTLKFLGEIPAERAETVAEALRRVAARHEPLTFAVSGVGWFPEHARRPRVIWAGVEAGPELAALHKDVERELKNAGFPEESRPFHPHLTLGRAKGGSNIKDLPDRLAESKAASFGRMTAGGITFFESRLQSGGAVHTALEVFSFP
ncbi:MAG: RNA 2',3'-cyclic phosphodiesterase [Candidatus Aminicenantes bacterium]|nr:RNA 2',3'-cyclic phosphodiesterase [Candidatus Aminicenantes bacterium]